MTRLFRALAIVASVALPAAAHAEGFYNGNEMLSMCENSRNIACVAYVQGVVDMQILAQKYAAPGRLLRMCSPPTLSSAQARDVALRYVTEHPADRHYGAASMIVVALAEAFPCPVP